jgi:hypothetical protein
MKKIKKQSPLRSEMPETSVWQIRHFLWYEQNSSYLRTTEKNQKQPSIIPVRSEISVSQAAISSGMNCIVHTFGMNVMFYIAGQLEKQKPQSASPACPYAGLQGTVEKPNSQG